MPPTHPGTAPVHAEHPLVLYDGLCSFCDASVAWIIARDRAARVHFAALQSRAAHSALAAAGVAPDTANARPDSVVLIHRGRVRFRSDAALTIARLLGWPWSVLAIFLVIPRPLRDAVYAFVARHRYRWFARRDVCVPPPPAVRARFLDADERTPAAPAGAPERS